MAAPIDTISNSLDPSASKSAPGDIPADGTGMFGDAVSSNSNVQSTNRPTSPGVVKLDPWLEPFSDALRSRFSKAQDWIHRINETEGGLAKFSQVHLVKSPFHDLELTEIVRRDSTSSGSM